MNANANANANVMKKFVRVSFRFKIILPLPTRFKSDDRVISINPNNPKSYDRIGLKISNPSYPIDISDIPTDTIDFIDIQSYLKDDSILPFWYDNSVITTCSPPCKIFARIITFGDGQYRIIKSITRDSINQKDIIILNQPINTKVPFPVYMFLHFNNDTEPFPVDLVCAWSSLGDVCGDVIFFSVLFEEHRPIATKTIPAATTTTIASTTTKKKTKPVLTILVPTKI